MNSLQSRRYTCGFLLALLCFAGTAFAQGYKAGTLNEPPPQEVSATVRESLAPTGIRVTGPSGPVCDLWLRKAVPGRTSPSTELGVTFPQIAQGTLVAVMRLPNATKDFRRQLIQPGVYTLRYAITPDNGNHMGVAPQRDFLLASPAVEDQSPDTVSYDQTLSLSKKTTGSAHPSVWSLSSAEENPKSWPAVFHMDDGDLWLVEFQVPVSVGGAAAPVKMALVVVGFAPEA
jgi:hypothetical protein